MANTKSYKTVKELSPRSIFKPLAKGSNDYIILDVKHARTLFGEKLDAIFPKYSNRIWAISLENGRLRSFWEHQRVEVVHFHLLVGDEQLKDYKTIFNSRKHD